MSTWIVLFAVAGGTYALRVSMFVLLGGRALPAWTDTPMTLVAPAAIAALVASLLLTRHGSVIAPSVPDLAAVAAGFVAVRRSGNVMHVFVAGLPVYWAASALVG